MIAVEDGRSGYGRNRDIDVRSLGTQEDKVHIYPDGVMYHVQRIG